MSYPNEKGTDVNHAERSTEIPSPRTGVFATLRVLLQGQGSGARSPRRHGRVVLVLSAALTAAVALSVLAALALASSSFNFKAELHEEKVFSTRAVIVMTLVDEANAPFEWHAEYSTSKTGPWTPAGGGTTLSPGGSQVEFLALGHDEGVEGNAGTESFIGIVHHLKPATTYYARFVASTKTEKAEETVQFTTLPVAKPEIPSAEADSRPTEVFVTGPFSAGFDARIESNGAQSEYHFEYATSEALLKEGKGTPFTSGASGTVTVAQDFADLKATATGLEPETHYFARLKATNYEGTAESITVPEGSAKVIESFTTPTAKPGFNALGVRNVTATSAHVTSFVVPHGSETHWRLESTTEPKNPASWAPVPGAAGTISQAQAEALGVDGISAVEGAVPGLSPFTVYYVRVFAENECVKHCGATTSEVKSFETSGPPAATTFAIHALHGEALRLLGSVNPNSLPTSEEQTVAIEGAPTGGTFTLTFEGQSTGGTTAGDLSAGSPTVTGIPLSAVKGTGNVAHGTGGLDSENNTVTGVTASVGRFHAGQVISGPGLASGTHISSVEGTTLNVSPHTTASVAGAELVSAEPGPFTVGDRISATGIPAGTTITAVEYPPDFTASLTLSANATETLSGAAFTADLPYDADGETVRRALENLPTGPEVSVSGPAGGPFTVFFSGRSGEVDQPQITADASGLTPFGSIAIAVATTQNGGEAYDTHYHFEYVSQVQFETEGGWAKAASTPVVDLGVGKPDKKNEGHAETEFLGADLPPLTPGETYRYRVSATNTSPGGLVVHGAEQTLTVPTPASVEEAAACPNQATRTGLSAALPDCRAYEQLTPVDKEGAQEIYSYGGRSGTTNAVEGAVPGEDGDHLMFGSTLVRWGTGPRAGQSPYFFSRDPVRGWQMTAAAAQPEAGFDQYAAQVFNPDLTQFGFEARGGGSTAVEFKAGPPGGPYATVAPSVPYPPGGKSNFGWVAASADFSKLVLAVEDRRLLEPRSATKTGNDLYEYSAGVLRQANVEAGGKAIGTCGAGVVNGLEAESPNYLTSVNAVSADGSRVFFYAVPVGSECPPVGEEETPGGGQELPQRHLYMRVDGETTVDIGVYRFLEADPQGSTLLVVHNGELFRYDTHTHATEPVPAGETLTHHRYSYTVTAGSGHANYRLPAEVSGFLASGTNGLGVSIFLAKALFGAKEDLPEQILRYDSAQHLIECLSCASPFDPEPKTASIYGGGTEGTSTTPVVSANGDYVFFDTPAALLPSDIDGEFAPGTNVGGRTGSGETDYSVSSDVYEWRRDGLDGCAHLQGCLALITSGRGGYLNLLLGIDPSGRDVFFSTNESLLPRDNDTAADIYVARIGGGFPEPPRVVECAGDACSTPFAAPNDLTPSSSTFQGAGNVPGVSVAVKGKHKPKAKKCKATAKKKCGAKHKKKTHRKTKKRNHAGGK